VACVDAHAHGWCVRAGATLNDSLATCPQPHTSHCRRCHLTALGAHTHTHTTPHTHTQSSHSFSQLAHKMHQRVSFADTRCCPPCSRCAPIALCPSRARALAARCLLHLSHTHTHTHAQHASMRRHSPARSASCGRSPLARVSLTVAHTHTALPLSSFQHNTSLLRHHTLALPCIGLSDDTYAGAAGGGFGQQQQQRSPYGTPQAQGKFGAAPAGGGFGQAGGGTTHTHTHTHTHTRARARTIKRSTSGHLPLCSMCCFLPLFSATAFL
jgi:hypothetical protein